MSKLVNFSIQFRQVILDMQGEIVQFQLTKLTIQKKYKDVEPFVR